ncbi:hypothetical protein HPG69_008412 [Diceros bicornis minor]|uniref:Uncharacterized protein n=1 Tax=Diceros bicornis minor TaxID=77932 RepID=A0A7J7ENG2_DICBM|nr:hypothetical protein HPG69_008412 [Diceros bicornis minor]
MTKYQKNPGIPELISFLLYLLEFTLKVASRKNDSFNWLFLSSQALQRSHNLCCDSLLPNNDFIHHQGHREQYILTYVTEEEIYESDMKAELQVIPDQL